MVERAPHDDEVSGSIRENSLPFFFLLSSTACIVRKRPVLHLPSKTLTMAKSSEGFLLVLTLFKNLGLSLTRLSQHAYEPQGRKIRNNCHLLEP